MFLSSVCEVISVIMLLSMWTFSALHLLGLCKKINTTSSSHMQVKTCSLSTVSIIPPAGMWEQKQKCRDSLQHNNNVTMSIMISK